MLRRLKNYYHLTQAVLANIYHGFPAKNLIVIGVTGTDGKTTTTNMIYHILKENGYDVSLISTVGAYINGEELPLAFHVTNPSSFTIQKFIKKIMVGNNPSTRSKSLRNLGKKYLVLEVSSHGIDQNRNWGIKFTVSGITNITHEHMDYHKTYDDYVWTKSKLIKMSELGFLNKDDESYTYLLKYLVKYKNKIKTYSLGSKSDYKLADFPNLKKISQKYNQENGLLAAAICYSLGLTKKQIADAFSTFKYPSGRLELVYDRDFKIFIDFAHTPNAFKNVLPEARNFLLKNGKLIHVFGCAAKRDETKRPLMGQFSAEFADKIILTAEDPRGESLSLINSEIKKDLSEKEKEKIIEINNRKIAIYEAIKMAKKGDVIILTGKAHEKSNNLGYGEEPWDEFQEVKNALDKLKL